MLNLIPPTSCAEKKNVYIFIPAPWCSYQLSSSIHPPEPPYIMLKSIICMFLHSSIICAYFPKHRRQIFSVCVSSSIKTVYGRRIHDFVLLYVKSLLPSISSNTFTASSISPNLHKLWIMVV